MATRLKPNERHSIAVLSLLVVICSLVALNHDRRSKSDIVEQIEQEFEVRRDSTTLKPFDPNIVELDELLDMGLNKHEAVSILRWRAAGKVFRIREELIECWGVSDSLYYALEPYIVIGEEYRYKRDTTTYTPEPQPTPKYLEAKPFTLDTVSADYLAACGLLSRRQAEVMLQWHATSHISNEAELRECYTVPEAAAERLTKYIHFTEEPTAKEPTAVADPQPINLNRADSATLLTVKGIGPKSARAIVDRRNELGGFHSVHQLRELKEVTKSNFEKIISQIFIDSCDISKIDVNFASANELSVHPYITDRMIRRILHIRQLKGGWSNIESMIDDKIFTSQEAQEVRPYLDFVLQDKVTY